MQSRTASSVAPSGKAAQRGKACGVDYPGPLILFRTSTALDAVSGLVWGARTGDDEVIDQARVTLKLLRNGVIL
ncbi:hypothetical protein ACTPOK_09190 [Streptomyces inhibens]|uniref:hypothetical protein n=1 Tax=Streptomyces inhibens TaxID=2293571 RepID=UPI00402A6B4C